jgi:dipeptidyl aminopeptidase/acylaminoacyl peptidase
MRLCCLVVLFVLSSLLSGCAAVGTRGAGHSGASIATHAFASNRATNFSYQISPDGSKLAWLSVRGAALVLNVRHLDSGRIVTRDAHGMLSFVWSADGRRLLSNALSAAPTENHVVVALEADGDDGALTVLAARAGANIRLLGTVAAAPDSLIVEHNLRDPAHPDLFRLSIATRQLTLLESNDGQVAAWLLRADGAVGARLVRGAAGAQALQTRQADGGYRTVYQWLAHDQVSVVSLANDGASSYLLSNKGAQRVRLIELDHASGAERVVHEDSMVDLSGVGINPASGAPVLVSSEPDYPRYSVLDAPLRQLLAQLPAGGPARVSIDSADRSFTRLVVALATDRGRAFYLADLAQQRLTLVGPASTAAFADALAPVTPVSLAARDGVTLHGYLSKPAGAGRLPPLVLRVHGGPWERTVWGYDPMTQFLVNRGYAVLEINFRGSTGYGRAFQALGDGEWGGAMQTDLYDAVAWIGAAGLADTSRSAIVGASYGGYASVAGVLDQPGTFACAIAVNAPLELGDMIDTLPEHFRHDRPLLLRYLGAHGAGDAVVKERSPGARAASLRRPLLLVQGANDARVNPLQAARFAAAAQAAAAPLSYWPVAGEGHLFLNWKTTLALYRRSEQFLAACAGGRDAGFDYYELGYALF